MRLMSVRVTPPLLCETQVTPGGGMLEVKICFQQERMIDWGRLGIIKAANRNYKSLSAHPSCSLQPLNINPQTFPTVTHKLSVLQPDLNS